MVKFPNNIVPYIAQDVLKVFVKALFIEYKDSRLICLIDDETLEERVEIIRNSFVLEDLIEALDLFGEEDVLKLIAPKIEKMADELSLRVTFKQTLESNFKTLI